MTSMPKGVEGLGGDTQIGGIEGDLVRLSPIPDLGLGITFDRCACA